MCFILSENSKIEILKKDKVVYKRITNDNHSVVYNNFKWEENKQYKLGKSLIINKKYNDIEEGFHAFTTYKKACEYSLAWQKIIKIIIPKDAEYIKNVDGECVSNIVETKLLENLCDN